MGRDFESQAFLSQGLESQLSQRNLSQGFLFFKGYSTDIIDELAYEDYHNNITIIYTVSFFNRF